MEKNLLLLQASNAYLPLAEVVYQGESKLKFNNFTRIKAKEVG